MQHLGLHFMWARTHNPKQMKVTFGMKG